jgi:cellobiose phosphorylase
VAVEAILGFHRSGDRLVLDPCIPGDWPGFELTYRHGSATYRISLENPDGVERGVRSVTLDGEAHSTGAITLADDGAVHEVRIVVRQP